MRTLATLATLLVGLAFVFLAPAAKATMCPDGSYVSGSTCTLCPNGSYVGGGRCVLQPDGTYTGGFGGYGGSPAPGPTFNRYPALEVEVPDFAGAFRKGQREAEALRTQRLQNQLLQQQIQQMQQQQQQLREQQRLLQLQQQQIQELRTKRVPAPQPQAAPTDAEQQSLVTSVQRVLASLGYDPGPSDGTVGPKTRAAIRAFQADHDLAVTGEATVSLEFDLYQQRLRQQQ